LGLRAYDTPHALARARHEFAIMRSLHERGYPVPCPLLLKEDYQPFGGPFLILPWVPGITLLEWLRHGFWRILNTADQLAGLHQALHALPLAGPFASPASFVERRLDELDWMIGDYDLAELTAGYAWLRERRPPPPARPSILHFDFHPVNVIVHDGRPQAVLDWSEADAGDPHADVAMTLVLLRTAPVAPETLHERLLARPARWWLARRYLRTYRRSSSLNPDVLRYYLAWASLRRLAVCGVWRRVGPWIHGFKASALRHATPSHEAALSRVFRHATGIDLSAHR
jgi:aminoglycoside phosphotransferase (APT) family kinase protein